MNVTLTPEIIKAIEDILNSGGRVEIAIGKGEILVWALKSKLKIKQPIA